jgi:hypothetical protein
VSARGNASSVKERIMRRRAACTEARSRKERGCTYPMHMRTRKQAAGGRAAEGTHRRASLSRHHMRHLARNRVEEHLQHDGEIRKQCGQHMGDVARSARPVLLPPFVGSSGLDHHCRDVLTPWVVEGRRGDDQNTFSSIVGVRPPDGAGENCRQWLACDGAVPL